MKVLQIIDVYNRAVGAQKVYDAYCSYCESKKIDLDRYTIYKSRNQLLKCLIEKNSNNLLKKVFQQTEGTRRLSHLIKNSGYNKIVSFLDRSNVMSIMAAKGKISVIATVHNPPVVQYEKLGKLKKIVFAFLKHCYNKKNVQVIAVSKQVKESLESLGVRNVKIVYNPLVVNENAVEAFNFSKPYFVAVGRLSYQKAHWKLIKAVSILKSKYHKEINLVIVGDGLLIESSKELAIALGVQNLITFTGFVENPFPIISEAFCMIFSSYFEGFPITVLESFHCNCPVIGAQIALPEEIRSEIPYKEYYYENKNLEENLKSSVFENDDYNLADIMNKALENSDILQKIAETGKKWVSENCGIENFNQYE